MKKLALLTFTLINFHIIKEFGIFFCFPPFLLYFYFIYKNLSIKKYKFILSDNYYILITIIIFSFILLSVNVLFDSELILEHKLLTLGRINFTYPILFLLIFTFDSINDYKKIINIYIAFNLLAAFFLIITVIVDNNIFLQNDYFSFKVRDNLIRYSTLYGSAGQTGYALSLPIFIVFMSNYSKYIKYIFLTIFFIAVTLSLSRAAYFNVILCFFIYLIINNKKTINEVIFILFILFIITPLIMNVLDIYNYYDYFFYKISGYSPAGIEYSISKNTSDLINIFDRVYYSVFKDFYSILEQNLISIQSFVFGNGYRFMGISLGLFNFNISNTMYIHNGFYEIFLSSGIIIFCCTLSLFYLTMKNMIKLSKINPESAIIRIFSGSLILITINIFLGASIIHPNLIAFFWVIISFVVNTKKNNNFIV